MRLLRASGWPVASLHGVTTFAWAAACLLLLVAVAAVVATRVSRLEPAVRVAVVAAEVVAALVVVADLGLVLRADPGERPASMLTHLGYAVAAVGLVPALVWRPPAGEVPDGAEEHELPEPVSPWVVAVALAAAAVCLVRLAQTR